MQKKTKNTPTFDPAWIFTNNSELNSRLRDSVYGIESESDAGLWQFKPWRGDIRPGQALYQSGDRIWVVSLLQK